MWILVCSLFLFVVVERCAAENYEVSFLIMRDYEDISKLTVYCGKEVGLTLSPETEGLLEMKSLNQIRCDNVDFEDGVLFVRSGVRDVSEKRFTDLGYKWVGYWEGIIIGVTNTDSTIFHTDCLADSFNVHELARSGPCHHVATIISDTLIGDFGIYHRGLDLSPLFVYEKKLKYLNGTVVNERKVRCADYETNNGDKMCCVERELDTSSNFLIVLHIFDDSQFDGLMVCVGRYKRDCSLGVHKAGIRRDRGPWRTLYISIPNVVLASPSEGKEPQFSSPLFLTIFGFEAGEDLESSKIKFRYEYIDYILYLEGKDLDIGGKPSFSTALNAIYYIKNKATVLSHKSDPWRTSIVQLKVGETPEGKSIPVEMFYFDGKIPRMLSQSVKSGSDIHLTLDSFYMSGKEARIFFRINKKKDELMYFDLKSSPVHLPENGYPKIGWDWNLKFVKRSEQEPAIRWW